MTISLASVVLYVVSMYDVASGFATELEYLEYAFGSYFIFDYALNIYTLGWGYVLTKEGVTDVITIIPSFAGESLYFARVLRLQARTVCIACWLVGIV